MGWADHSLNNQSDHRRAAEGSGAGFSMVEILIVMAIIAIIASIALSAGQYAFDASRLGSTVAGLRGVADAILKYQADNSALPPGGLQQVSAIAAVLRPAAGSVAQKDGWGHDLYYEQITGGGVPTFRVYSYGKDGTPDGAVTGTWVDFYTDIVFEGSAFIQTKW